MKNTFLLIALFFLSFSGLAMQADTTIVDTAVVEQTMVQNKAIFSNISFKFSNYTDKRTTKTLNTGSSNVKFDSILVADKYVAFRYKGEGSKEWNTQYFNTEDKKVVLENLDENIFYSYQLGSGNDTNNINFNTEVLTFNTLSSSVFKNFSAKGKEEGGKLFWGLELDKILKIILVMINTHFL